MSNELIIDFSSTGERIALLQDKKLVELHEEDFSSRFSVGDLYLGVIKKFKHELNAAFVDVGYHKDAFLHYQDLGPKIRSIVKLTKGATQGGITSGDLTKFKIEPDTVKTGQITDVLRKGQQILVQVAKEPISSKGPKLSTEISIAGKYYILVPFINSVTVSKKIESAEERKRLKNLTLSLKGANFGLICRTAAEGKTVQDLHKDLIQLQEKWDLLIKNLNKAKPGDLILGEDSRSHMVLRDMLSQEFSAIVTNDAKFHKDLKEHLSNISPELVKVLKLYKGKEPTFSQFGVDKQIKMSFGKSVAMQGGAYLIIEHTEALHVIDVNSGNRQKRKADSTDYSLNVNIESAKEIARQLRLRDMGGIIVIDFIDLRNPAHKKSLLQELRKAMSTDPAKHTILPMSKFGLVQITRQRVRPETSITTAEACPMCKGEGKVEASILITDEIEHKLDQIINFSKPKKVELVVHPFIEAYLNKGVFGSRWKWFTKYRTNVKITPDANYHYGEYHFFDANDEEIVV